MLSSIAHHRTISTNRDSSQEAAAGAPPIIKIRTRDGRRMIENSSRNGAYSIRNANIFHRSLVWFRRAEARRLANSGVGILGTSRTESGMSAEPMSNPLLHTFRHDQPWHAIERPLGVPVEVESLRQLNLRDQ